MEEISRTSLVKINWDCLSHDYSRDKEKDIIDKFSKKYNIPKSRIKVNVNIINIDENGSEISIQDNVLNKISDPDFQQKLFVDYITMNNIEDVDMNRIIEIDNDINQKIDYDVYEKFGKIVIKRVDWSNFLSYGNDNSFDFTKLHGLVSLSGEPSNQSGKTTFALSLLKFALYGTCDKAKTLDKIFNKHLKNETEVYVRLFIEINGQDFLIERILTRPKKRSEKSKTSQQVKYYRIINGLWDQNAPLKEYDEEFFKNESDDVVNTNKLIKECLCKESDFDLVASATSKNLDDIVFLGDTERGKLFSRWIGILPLQEKEQIAKDKWSKEINPKLLSNQYNAETLQQGILDLKEKITSSEKVILNYKDKLAYSDNSIKEYSNEKEKILSTKGTVNPDLIKIDIETQESKKNVLLDKGKNLRLSEKEYTGIINELSKYNVDENVVIMNRKTILTLTSEIATIKSNISNLKNNNESLETSKVCPTCKRPYDKDTISHIEKSISENKKKIKLLIDEGVEKANKKKELEEQNIVLEEDLKKIKERDKTELKLAQIRVDIEKTLSQYTEITNTIKEFEKNKDIIFKNNELDILVKNLNDKIKTEQGCRDEYVRNISQEEKNIELFKRNIDDNEKLMGQLYVESIYIRHYKLYLQLMGKHGIQTILINRVLPILNANINNLLSDICDFTVEIKMSEKNDLQFLLLQENADGETIVADLSSASGYELTVAAVAIRSVLAKVSSFTRINFSLWDEITGRVAEENLEYIRSIFDKIKDDYQFIFLISHNKTVNDWCEQKVIVTKNEQKISHILTNYDY